MRTKKGGCRVTRKDKIGGRLKSESGQEQQSRSIKKRISESKSEDRKTKEDETFERDSLENGKTRES